MIMKLSCDVVHCLNGITLATAESCTGGGIGAAITSVSGSSKVFKGGIISYTNEIKIRLLGVDKEILSREGAVSAPVAEAMACGARKALKADIAVSVTGLAGPDGDDFGNPVGTVYIGYCDSQQCISHHFRFEGGRDAVREQVVTAALELILEYNK